MGLDINDRFQRHVSLSFYSNFCRPNNELIYWETMQQMSWVKVSINCNPTYHYLCRIRWNGIGHHLDGIYFSRGVRVILILIFNKTRSDEICIGHHNICFVLWFYTANTFIHQLHIAVYIIKSAHSMYNSDQRQEGQLRNKIFQPRWC